MLFRQSSQTSIKPYKQIEMVPLGDGIHLPLLVGENTEVKHNLAEVVSNNTTDNGGDNVYSRR